MFQKLKFGCIILVSLSLQHAVNWQLLILGATSADSMVQQPNLGTRITKSS